MAKINDNIMLEVLTEDTRLKPEEAATAVEKALRRQQEEKVPTQPRQPAEYVVVVNDPNCQLPEAIMGWVIKKVEYHDAESESTTSKWGDLEVGKRIDELGRKIKNNPKQAKKLPYGDCFIEDILEYAPASAAKECGLNIVTKIPIAIVPVRDIKVNIDY